MSAPSDTVRVAALDVRVGDRLRARDGRLMTVTRIDNGFLGRAEMIAFVEDSETQWFKLPARVDSEVELVSRVDAA